MSADPPPGSPPDDFPEGLGARLAGVRVSAPKCVRCAQPVQPRYRPFCSQRCADADLGAWFTARYRVATNEPLANADDPGEDER